MIDVHEDGVNPVVLQELLISFLYPFPGKDSSIL